MWLAPSYLRRNCARTSTCSWSVASTPWTTVPMCCRAFGRRCERANQSSTCWASWSRSTQGSSRPSYKDVDDCVGLHVDLTDRIEKGADGKWPEEKFLCSTPRLQDAAYLRVLDPTLGPNAGAPLGHRIVGDFGRCYGRYLTATCRKKGWAIDEHKAAGHRWRAGGQHGGARVKKPAAADDWVHPDAQAGIQLIKAAASRASLSTPSPPPLLHY
jgi:hypothetical protein